MNDYFCVLPFFAYENQQDRSDNMYCCRLKEQTNIEDVRQSIKNKQRSPNCETCWSLEDQGLPSERQLHNRSFDFYLDRDLELIEQDAVTQGYQPRIVKLTTSNLCNGTCMTCGSGASTAWAKLEHLPIQYEIMDTTPLDNIDFSKIVQLSLLGGEPLLERRNFQILEKLIELKNTSCFVSIVTNGSIELNAQQLQTLSQFENLNICVSIDGVGPQFEYIRWPLKWPKLLQNLAEFKRIARHVSVSCMISNLNILHYTDMIDFFDQQGIAYLCKQIESPDYFAPANLPAKFKQLVIERNPRYQSEVTAFLQLGATNLIQEFWKDVDRQDALKGIRINDYLPELAATRI
jgi:hypothetical protein